MKSIDFFGRRFAFRALYPREALHFVLGTILCRLRSNWYRLTREGSFVRLGIVASSDSLPQQPGTRRIQHVVPVITQDKQKSVGFFQLASPRFGNLIGSLIVLRTLSAHYEAPTSVSLAPCALLQHGSFRWNSGRTLVGVGAAGETLKKAEVFVHNSFFLPEIVKDEIRNAKEAREDIRRLVRFPEDDRPAADNELTMHVRGGDIFARHPHPGYSPPPLSFYTSILREKSWERVTVVTEDTVNPLFMALRNHLLGEGVEFSVLSGNLMRALAVLMGARHLVAGTGTFVPAVSYLSRSLESLYTVSPLDLYPPEKAHVQNIAGHWAQYRRVLGPWEANKRQISTMLEWRPDER